jgi:hypothetical protein
MILILLATLSIQAKTVSKPWIPNKDSEQTYFKKHINFETHVRLQLLEQKIEKSEYKYIDQTFCMFGHISKITESPSGTELVVDSRSDAYQYDISFDGTDTEACQKESLVMLCGAFKGMGHPWNGRRPHLHTKELFCADSKTGLKESYTYVEKP